MEEQGYQYGEDALEQVKFGWEMAQSHARQILKALEYDWRVVESIHGQVMLSDGLESFVYSSGKLEHFSRHGSDAVDVPLDAVRLFAEKLKEALSKEYDAKVLQGRVAAYQATCDRQGRKLAALERELVLASEQVKEGKAEPTTPLKIAESGGLTWKNEVHTRLAELVLTKEAL